MRLNYHLPPDLQTRHPQTIKQLCRLVCSVSLGLAAGQADSEPWWHTCTPFVTAHGNLAEITGIHGGVIRGVGYYGGWYGFWYLDAQEQFGWAGKTWSEAGRSGMKRILYYDLGEVGDYAGFFNTDGEMKYNGWTLPQWKGGEPLTARWFGIEAFMRDVPWAPYPTARAYSLPPFTTPDGQPADDIYSVLTRRGLDGEWKYDYSSNPNVTDALAEQSGLAGISGKQQSQADTQGKTGWQTVRLVDVDYANPQLREYCCREIERIIPKVRPDGIHADNYGDANLGFANLGAFGLWSVATFRDFLKHNVPPEELPRMGISDPSTFDIAAYVRSKNRKVRSPEWTTDPVWLCYLIHLADASQSYHRAFYAAAKKSAHKANLDCAVFGNTIPLPHGGSLMKGACDVDHFEWSTVHGWWGMKPMGLPPKGRLGYVARLGAAISDAPFCWPSLYVEKNKSGKGHENLHKTLAFDGLANRGILDYGNWFLDGYSPGTAESAKFINRFVQANASVLGSRRYLADIAVVHSAWSEIASNTVCNPVLEMFADEYAGWCQFLGDTHRQWDVVLQQDLTAENLTRFPIVVLPSVMVLTDAQAGELRRYVESGGRLVATGLSGTRYDREDFLAVRPTNVLAGLTGLPNVRVITEKPGVAYWRKDADKEAAGQMAALLDWPAFRPRLETNAPAVVGVNLNIATGKSPDLLTLDLNNCDIDAESDTLHPAPPCETKIILPDNWKNRPLRISFATPEMSDAEAPVALAEDRFSIDAASGILHVNTPPFSTYLLLSIRRPPIQDTENGQPENPR